MQKINDNFKELEKALNDLITDSGAGVSDSNQMREKINQLKNINHTETDPKIIVREIIELVSITSALNHNKSQEVKSNITNVILKLVQTLSPIIGKQEEIQKATETTIWGRLGNIASSMGTVKGVVSTVVIIGAMYGLADVLQRIPDKVYDTIPKVIKND